MGSPGAGGVSAGWRVAPCRRCGSALVEQARWGPWLERLCVTCGELEWRPVRRPRGGAPAPGEVWWP